MTTARMLTDRFEELPVSQEQLVAFGLGLGRASEHWLVTWAHEWAEYGGGEATRFFSMLANGELERRGSLEKRMSLFNDPKLDQLLEQAKAAFDKLSPEEKVAHRRAQAIDFALGNVRLSGTKVTREQMERIYDQLKSEGQLVHI